MTVADAARSGARAGCDRREVVRLVSYPVRLALVGASLLLGVLPGLQVLPSWALAWLPPGSTFVIIYGGLALGALLLFVSVICAGVVAVELVSMWVRAHRGSPG